MNLRAILPLAIFAGLIAAFALGLGRDPQKIPSQLIDQPVPEFTLPSLMDADAAIAQTDLPADVHMLNVFGSWCTACVAEHPVLTAIAKSGAVKIVGIDWRDTRTDAKAWLAQHGDPYAQIIFDPKSELAIALGVTGAPETFIIDGRGRIRYKFTGIITPQVWSQSLSPLITFLRLEAQQ